MIKKIKALLCKPITLLIILLAAIVTAIALLGHNLLYGSDFKTKETVYIYINRSTTFEQLCNELTTTAECKKIKDFIFLAEKLNYPSNMKPGKYAIEPGMTRISLVNRLRRGQQTASSVTFNNIRTKDELAEKLAAQLMISKDDITAALNNPNVCKQYGFTPENITTLFIPNTYEIYWTIDSGNLLRRMMREYRTFWNEARRTKAKNAGLSLTEVSILASIVEEETAVEDEYPVIAGLYLNRLRKGILLQADPTVKYAHGDLSLKRILDKHKETNSPYNTYIYKGLPPGPIRLPSIKAIDGVLNYMQHKYLYMCAKSDFSGRHNFAVTLSEHNRNAAKYHAELNRRKIK